jgi:hypothetical protein
VIFDIEQMINITIGAFASFILSFITIIWIEKIKLPYLEMIIEEPIFEQKIFLIDQLKTIKHYA